VVANSSPGSDEFAAAVSAVTSAFGDPSRRRIYLFVRDAEAAVTTAEVAERFGIHPNVARHHLDRLAAAGYLEVGVERSGAATAGRPSKRYRPSTKDTGLTFPARRDDLLVMLLARTLALVPRGEAEAMAEELGRDYGRQIAQGMVGTAGANGSVGESSSDEVGIEGPSTPSESGIQAGHRSLRVALHAVADALTAHGFSAHVEARTDGLAIIGEQCPFGEAAIEHPIICAVDRGIVAGMLSTLYGTSLPETRQSRAQGDQVCVTVV